jgi:DNA-binding transcriptional MerR regulator
MKSKGQRNDSDQAPRELSLADLAAEAKVPERTIRYYIARGLLSGPARGGRGAFYTGGHLDELREIQERQRQGLTLAEIERQRRAGEPPVHLPEPAHWWAYTLAPDVVVQVRTGGSPWRMRQIKSTLERLARELRDRDERKEG